MLNLITDPWIPVLRESGMPEIVRPDQIADPDVQRFNWPRADLNLACHELLVGMIYLACPPTANSQRFSPPDADTFRAGLEPLIPAFNLLGVGPCFMQDFEILEGEAKAPDMLFIDSAGAATQSKNADLMVRRSRYPVLPLPLAAMALYTLQAFAPAGGSGNRTSMRGGGPMVTLVKPKGQGLWQLVWANVPCGKPLGVDGQEKLPWMRPTATSEKGQVVTPTGDVMNGPHPEMFFGQPRRLRLVGTDAGVSGVIQRKYGTNYTQWIHYLTPYYRDKSGQVLPVHPKPGPFSYHNWRGILLKDNKSQRAEVLKDYPTGPGIPSADLIVAGWAMDNMKPLDFLWSEQPIFPLNPDAEYAAISMVEAAEQVVFLLTKVLCIATNENNVAGGMADTARRSFFNRTQTLFERRLGSLSEGKEPDHAGWLKDLRNIAIPIFDAEVLPGLSQMHESRRKKVVEARKSLVLAFEGYGSYAKKIYDPLELELPATKQRKKTT